MRIQFINHISLDLISGGNLYNSKIIEGLSRKGFRIDYDALPKNESYDLSIIDSLALASISWKKLEPYKETLIALIHQIPNLKKEDLEFHKTHTRFIVTGAPTKKQLINNWHIKAHNIEIIRPGISKQWQPKTKFEILPKRILMVSNFIPNKGYEMLFQILNRLEQFDLTFDIVGNPELDPEYSKSILKTIRTHHPKVRIHFNLDRDDLYKLLLASDLYLGLSKSESFGMAIYEALCMGLPCLCYNTGDHDYFKMFPNYIGLEQYESHYFSEILKDWIQKPNTYHSYCNGNPKDIRYWDQVVDEFSSFLTNTNAP